MFDSEEVMSIGVIDRIEDAGVAVVLIEDDAKQIELSLEELNEDVKEGDVLQLRFKADAYEIIRIDSELTKERKQQANQLLQQLQEKR